MQSYSWLSGGQISYFVDVTLVTVDSHSVVTMATEIGCKIGDNGQLL